MPLHVSADTQTYPRATALIIGKASGLWGGLSNMAREFPLEVAGRRIATAEALYQACRFPHRPDVQRRILAPANPMTAKLAGRTDLAAARSDWDAVRLSIMRWCLRVKLAQHWDRFGGLLLATGDRPLVAESSRNSFWAARAAGPEILVGENWLGRLLMELRAELRADATALRTVVPPAIDNFVLEGQPIRLIPTLTVTITQRALRDTHPDLGDPVMPVTTYPKRLIEVDLPIRRISEHARHEKGIRHGHISTLHIWWARRPLAACRAVICAALWPDPADPICPPAFREAARKQMALWANEYRALLGAESNIRFASIERNPAHLDDGLTLRQALLDFIADFANWDNASSTAYLTTARTLTQAAHDALGGTPGTKPLVVDPFAGGGAIPLEALRVGADAFASDLNPVAVLLNKVVLDYIPRYGLRLAGEVRKWGAWVKEQAEQELAEFYPKDPDGSIPIAYLWARTITCEGPGCGVEIPLIRSLWLSKKSTRSVALRLVCHKDQKRIDFAIVENAKAKDVSEGTVRRGSTICPICGYTTAVSSVRRQLKTRRGGSMDARLFAVATIHTGYPGRFYRLPMEHDFKALNQAAKELEIRKEKNIGSISLVPDEKLDIRGIRHTWAMIYGLDRWSDYFTARQALALTTLTRLISTVGEKLSSSSGYESDMASAIQTCLALNIGKIADLANSLCVWEPGAECPRHLFARQAVPMTWDFAEGVLTGESSGSWSVLIDRFSYIMTEIGSDWNYSTPQQASATNHPLPDDSVDAFITDPPYYDAIPYSYLSDFFYVWLKRSLGSVQPDLFMDDLVPKDAEIIVDRPHELSNSTKDITFYERELERAFGDGRRILRPFLSSAKCKRPRWGALRAHPRFRYNCSAMTSDLRSAEDPRDARLAALDAHIARLEAQLAARDARIAELEAQLAAVQQAGKRQATPFARRERKANPQKPGRKKGQGHFAPRDRPRPDQITETKTVLLPACPHCAGPIQERATQEQFQIELPAVQPTVTCFVTESGYCPACAARVHSVHSEQISTAHGAAGVVFGPRLKAFAADLHHRLGVSYGKIADLLREMFGLPVTRGGLAHANARLARTARPIYEHLLELLRVSAVVHVDETGWRIGALAAWLWVFTNTQITVYDIATSRGHEVVLRILGREFRGILVADSFRAYDAAALADWLQQKCVAHLLRNLHELLESKQGRARQFAQQVLDLLREALALKAGATDLRTAEYEAAAAALEARLDRLLDPARRLRDADNQRLAARLRKHRPDILRFLYWEELDATNNLAERQLRPAVITRKTGGCNRSDSGARTHAILASVLATCRQQAVSILDYLIALQQFGATPPALAPA